MSVNVLVILADALRPDHLGCYGSRWTSTPHVDALASHGLLFERAISAAPWTAPSTMSIVSGLLPQRHGYLGWRDEPDPAVVTVFDRFVDAGYQVGSFVFDERYLFKGLRNANVLGESSDPGVARDWLLGAAEPFFGYVHSWATHLPRHVPHGDRPAWRAAKQAFLERLRSDSAAEYQACLEEYREAVEWMSGSLVGELLRALEARGIAERTVVVFLSDHGESWGERLSDKAAVGGIYHLHGATLFDEILHVPLIVRAPGLAPGRVREQVSTLDLAPTLLELAGLPSLDGDGRSLLGELRSDEEPVVSVTTDGGRLSQLSLRTPPWKLIRELDSGAERAFRLDVDPRELVDRAAEAPESLRFLLEREIDDIDLSPLSEAEEGVVVERLRDLGYL